MFTHLSFTVSSEIPEDCVELNCRYGYLTYNRWAWGHSFVGLETELILGFTTTVFDL